MNPIYAEADSLVKELAPMCRRIEIAGSLRRFKESPKDIEIVAIPDTIQQPNLFGEVAEVPADPRRWFEHLALWQLYNGLGKCHGPKWWKLVHKSMHNGAGANLYCDLFLTTERDWGVTMVIRTGPGEFGKELMILARRRGLLVEQNQLWREHRNNKKEVMPTLTEQAFFEALGLPYIEPEARTLKILARARAPVRGRQL